MTFGCSRQFLTNPVVSFEQDVTFIQALFFGEDKEFYQGEELKSKKRLHGSHECFLEFIQASISISCMNQTLPMDISEAPINENYHSVECLL